jgi:lipoprotein-anchoring transpeptidase ErfK/SrfK
MTALQRSVSVADYYSILSRAVAALENNTAQARAELFGRARHVLIDGIKNERERWTDDAAMAEIAKFDAATDRIESQIARHSTHDSIERHRQPRADQADWAPAPSPDTFPPPSNWSIGRIVVLGAAGLFGLGLIGLVVYALSGQQAATTKAPATEAVATAPGSAKKIASRAAPEGDDLEPGIDGGSTDAGLPYFLRRQVVYYRSVYSDGMIVVDRSQRFLYLVQQQARAWRYGIGVGGECDIGPGLYRIKSKSPQWPEWSPSPALLKRRNYPQRIAGGPGNPLGAYALYFESSLPGIHGTNAPRSIGQAPTLGCFRLINDDVIDLEKRIAIGTGVVVMN